jgi:hypothetical protein
MIVSQAPLPVNQGTVGVASGKGMTSAETATFIKEEIQRWGEVIRSNNIVVE